MRLVATALFVGGPYFDVRTKDCLTFALLAEKEVTARFDDGEFARFKVPPHADSDGASLPEIADRISPSLRERMFGSAFVHDACYRGTLLQMVDGVWVKGELDREQADSLIRALMFIEAVSTLEREAVYAALRFFGQKAWAEDRKAQTA